jgi:tRNA G18 (ribose-2'-O)-methylase SpoU
MLLLLLLCRCVYLPMYGFTESLNVGVASGLVSESFAD